MMTRIRCWGRLTSVVVQASVPRASGLGATSLALGFTR